MKAKAHSANPVERVSSARQYTRGDNNLKTGLIIEVPSEIDNIVTSLKFRPSIKIASVNFVMKLELCYCIEYLIRSQ